jgi:hypothetical protein
LSAAEAGFLSNAGKILKQSAQAEAIIIKQGIKNREVVRAGERILRGDVLTAKCLLKAVTSTPCKTD